MELEDIAEITQGNILTRIKSTSGMEFKAFTMQQLSFSINASDSPGLYNKVIVNKERTDNLCLAKENDVLVGLASGKAMKVSKKEEGFLVLSNFIRIRIKDNVQLNPDFLCWIFNENKDILRYFASMTQGTARVSIIPLPFIKCLNIDLLPLNQQMIIGRIYQLKKEKMRIVKQKEEVKSLIIEKKLFEIYKTNNTEENENE